MAGSTSETGSGHPDGGEAPNDLTVIRQQTSECLELLRSLVALMLAKQAEDDGPKLETLIAALVAQQRDILIGVRRIQEDLTALFGRIDRDDPPRPNGTWRPNGGGHA